MGLGLAVTMLGLRPVALTIVVFADLATLLLLPLILFACAAMLPTVGHRRALPGRMFAAASTLTTLSGRLSFLRALRLLCRQAQRTAVTQPLRLQRISSLFAVVCNGGSMLNANDGLRFRGF
jgi:hypothetical protein